MALAREQKIAKAECMFSEGRLLREIAAEFGVSKTTAHRWASPDRRERDRQRALAWKARNKPHLRRYSKGYEELAARECGQCGGRLERQAKGEKCASCIEEDGHHKALQVVEWWAEGLTGAEIAKRLGTTRNAFAVMLHRWRERGYDLPYRYSLNRKPRFPEQVAA